MLICFNGLSVEYTILNAYFIPYVHLKWFVSVVQSLRKLLMSLTWLDSLFLPRSLWFLWDLLVKGGLK